MRGKSARYRCAYSDQALRCLKPRYPESRGWAKDNTSRSGFVTVLWDGRKCTSSYAKSFIRKLSPEELDAERVAGGLQVDL